MEILTLLRLNGKRLTALATVGALTGAAAAAAVSRQSATFQASTTVFVSQALPDGASAFDVGPLVSDFQKAVTLPQVRQAAAEKLDLDLDAVAVTATRNGNDGGSVEVVAGADTATDAEAISQTVSTEAMRFLAQREVDRATKNEQDRQAAVDDAQATIDQLLVDNGYANPVSTYDETLTRLLQLTLDKSDPTKNYTNEQRVAADAETTRLRLQLPPLKQLADEYAKAETELNDDTAALKIAKSGRTSAEEVLAAATTDVAISAGETAQASKLASMVQAFAAALVATFLAGIAFFFVSDNGRRNQAQAKRAVAPAGAAGGPRPQAAATPAGGPRPQAAAAPAATPTPADPSPARGASRTTATATASTRTPAATSGGSGTASSSPAKGTGGSAPSAPAASTASAAPVASTTKAAPADSPSASTKAASDTATPAAVAAVAHEPATLEAVEAALEAEGKDLSNPSAPGAATAIDLRTPRPAPTPAEGRRSAGLTDTQSVFSRGDGSGKTAPADENGNGNGNGNGADGADGRNRKSASNRRRLGS